MMVDSINVENLFVHRLDVNGSAIKMGMKTPNTFWKSPYRGKSASESRRGFSIRPVINVTSPICDSKPLSAETYTVPVKSILKNRSEEESDTDKVKVSETRRPLSPQFITTGTGKGIPYGVNSCTRPKTTGKRVQFNKLPAPYQSPYSAPLQPPTNRSYVPFKGRRLYLDKSTSARILGSYPRGTTPWQNGVNKSVDTAELGDANIKTQISAFIRKLRLAENEKVLQTQSQDVNQTLQQRTADKLRKSRAFTAVSRRTDWKEFDIDVSENVQKSDEIHDNKDVNTEVTLESKSILESESISIDSFSSYSEKKVVPKKTSHSAGNGLLRTAPKASLHTKYRHITSNYMNRYANKMSVIPSNQRNKITKGCNPVNFCDSGKTDQILGWLEEVQSANAENTGS